MNEMTISADLSKTVGASQDPEEIKAALIAEVERQAAAGAEQAATDAAANAAAVAAKTTEDKVVTRTEVIGGQEFEFTGTSDADVDRKVLDAYRIAFALQPSAVEVVSPEAAQAAEIAEQQASEKRAAEKAELELKFKRGEISVKDYLRQSGELADYLAEQGISVDKLRETVNAKAETDYERTWQSATDYFIAHSDWPGGTKNLQLMGMKLVAMGLDDAEDKVAAYQAAYDELKKDGILFPHEPTPEEIAAERAAAGSTTDTGASTTTTDTPIIREVRPTAGADVPVRIIQTPAQVNAARTAAPAPKRAASSSAITGASSGVGAETDRAGTRRPAPMYEISREATPEQILEAWKKSQAEQGIHPDAAWQQQFSRRSA